MTKAARRAVGGGAAAAVTALGLWSGWFEPRRLQVKRERLSLTNWPRALDGLRVGLVSDLHAGGLHVGPERVAFVVDRMNAEGPDLICLLGDFVDPRGPLSCPVAPERVAESLRELRAPAGTVAVLGNHDWRADGERVRHALRRVGVPVLENDALRTRVSGHPLWLAGLADPRLRRPDVRAALASVAEGEPAIVLSHDPDCFPEVPERVALTVSGHTHGGQVHLPGLHGVGIPSIHGARYRRGHVVERGRQLFVTSGVGTSGLPVRLRVVPEIVVLELRARR